MNIKTAHTESLVSVCIPTYNRSAKLQRAVDALIKCSYANLEIIISDNASSDATQSVCTTLLNLDKRIKYFRHAENQGPTKNFEFARAQAKGKYFLWLSDDDYHDPDYIRVCVDELERDSSFVLVSGLGAYHRGDGKLSRYENVIQPSSVTPLFRVVKFLWYVGESSIIYGVCRRADVKDCIMPNFLGGDWAWVSEVLLKGKIKVIPTTYVHREFGESMSSSYKCLVSTLRVPHWHASFPWLAMSANIASHLAFGSYKYRDSAISKRLFIYSLGFVTISLKRLNQQLHSYGSKIPFIKKIYRRLIEKLAGAPAKQNKRAES